MGWRTSPFSDDAVYSLVLSEKDRQPSTRGAWWNTCWRPIFFSSRTLLQLEVGVCGKRECLAFLPDAFLHACITVSLSWRPFDGEGLRAWYDFMVIVLFLDLGTGSKIDATAVRNVVDPFSLSGWPFGREGRVLITGQTVGIYDSIVQKCTFFGFQLLISYWFWCVHSREAVVWFYFGCWTFCFISDGTTTCSVWSDYLVVGWEWTAQHTW